VVQNRWALAETIGAATPAKMAKANTILRISVSFLLFQGTIALADEDRRWCCP
jgi:hypothetical protein